MTERERRALLRARSGVRSWADLLADARTAHYSSAAEEPADPLARGEREYEQLEESA
jgi:WhiB family redox-sensing transcriptional regulator